MLQLLVGHTLKVKTDNYNVNSASNVANQSNNSTNTNGSVAYLNLNNSPSNTNANISSRLLPIGSLQFASKQYSTSPLGEKLVEAGKQFNNKTYPFTTTIIIID